VYKHKQSGKWWASIRVKEKTHYGGFFADISDAISSRKALEREYGFHQNHGVAND